MSAEDLEFRCGAAARQRGDTLIGTAAPATSWLLVEHRGPWPRRAFEDSPLDPVAGAGIAARARSIGARPLFIRRHGRRVRERQFAFVDAATGQIGWQKYDQLTDVLAADWGADSPLAEPLYLVCAHGRHDRCCAIAGRPVAAELSRLRADRTWECSHLGGDRFAGNVLVLPTGATYGFVNPLDASAIVAASERDHVYLPLLRGYSTNAPMEQAARIAAQQRLGLHGAGDLPVVGTERRGGSSWRIRLRDMQGGSDVVVSLMQERVADERATCAHLTPVAMHQWRIQEIRTDSPQN